MKKILFTLFLLFGLVISSLAQNSTQEVVTIEKENSLVNIKKKIPSFQKNIDQNINMKNVTIITIQKEKSPIMIKTYREVKTNNEEEKSLQKEVVVDKKSVKLSNNKKTIKN